MAGSSPMHEPNLDDLKGFNRHLLAVSGGGLPIELSLEHPGESLGDFLTRIERMLGVHERDLLKMMSATSELTPAYLSAFMTWLETEQAPLAFAPYVSVGQTHRRTLRAWRFSLFYPALWMTLGYFALLYICSELAQRIDALAVDAKIEPGIGMRTVSFLRETMAWWAIGLPVFAIAACLVATWFAYKKARNTRRMGYAESIRRSSLASVAADMIEHGVAPDQAWQMAQASELAEGRNARRTNSAALLEWAQTVDTARSHGDGKEPDGEAAINTDQKSIHESDISSPAAEENLREESRHTAAASRFAAQVYDRIALIHLERLQDDRVSGWGIVLGGVIALIVGLCVFLPTVEMLNAVSEPVSWGGHDADL